MQRPIIISVIATAVGLAGCQRKSEGVVSDVKSTSWTNDGQTPVPAAQGTPAPEGAKTVASIEMLKTDELAATPNPVIAWTPHDDAAFYEVKIDDSEGCTSPVSEVTTQDTSVAAPYLENGSYVTCVTAFDADGTKLASQDGELLVMAKEVANPAVQNASGGSGAALAEDSVKIPELEFGTDDDEGISAKLGLASEREMIPFSFSVFSDARQHSKVKFAVSDRKHARILIWDSIPKTPADRPDRVIGQFDKVNKKANAGTRDVHNAGFADPTHVTVCPDGQLIVTDRGNNRVLIWRQIPEIDGAPAEIVIGQKHFASRDPGLGKDGLNQPFAAYCIGKSLFILDRGNHRILGYHKVPDRNGAPADFVLGQGHFNDKQPGCRQERFGSISDLAYDGEKLYVVDSSNHRVLVYDKLPNQTGIYPDNVIGQPDFDTCKENRGRAKGEHTLASPSAISVSQKYVAISDAGNKRVLVFERPLKGDPKAIHVIGGERSFKEPRGMIFQGDKTLIINDHERGRLTKVAIP